MDGDPDTGEGAEAGEQEQHRPAATGMTRDEFHAKERAAFLAGAGQDEPTEDKPEPDKPKPKKIIGAPVDDEDDADEEPVEAEADDDADDSDDDESEDDDEDDAAADDDEADEDLAAKDDADPELAKRREAMRQTERRQRASLARDRAAFEAERNEWKTQSKTVTDAQRRFDDLVARVRYNPTAVLRELGLTEDDLEGAAQHVAAHSKAAGVTPAHKAAAERAMREREAADKATNAEKRVAKLEETIEQERREAAAQRELDVYFRRTFRKADDTAPRVKALVAADPKAARAELEVTALELAQKLGRLPKPSAVVAAHEKKIARQLKRYGVESAAPAAIAPAKDAKPGAGKPKPGAKPTTTESKREPGPHPSINGMTVLPTRVTIPGRDEIVKELEELS